MVAGTAPGVLASLPDKPPSGAEKASALKEGPELELDPALRESQEHLATTNLLPAGDAAKPPEVIRREKLQLQLDLARQHRKTGSSEQAEKTLTSILASDPPPEIQRGALLELALWAQDNKKLLRAQKAYSQFVHLFPDDAGVPEVLLRQGLIYREMGLPIMALSKFYAVMSSSLTLKMDRLQYYQRLVLQAQTEIADTYYLDGKYVEAADFLKRLLKLESPDLNRAEIRFKLVRSLAAASQDSQAATEARLFLKDHPESDKTGEVRFLLAKTLKNLGRKKEAMDELLALVEAQKLDAGGNREIWSYWQQRIGNELANQLYEDGEYLQALNLYLKLAELNDAPVWRLPSLYQAGLIYEKLKQPAKAAEIYERLLGSGQDPTGEIPPSAETVMQMARWRRDRLDWQTRAEAVNQQLTPVNAN